MKNKGEFTMKLELAGNTWDVSGSFEAIPQIDPKEVMEELVKYTGVILQLVATEGDERFNNHVSGQWDNCLMPSTFKIEAHRR